MNSIKIILSALLISGVLTSCLEEQETPQEIYQRDLEKIDEYLSTSDYPYVEMDQDENTGIVVLWEHKSYSGIEPEEGDTLHVDYTGMLLNESVFDSSNEDIARDNRIYNSNRDYVPLEIKYLHDNDYIYGFLLGLSKMEEGDRARVIMPSYYGYGNVDQGSRIPANSVLMFDLDLIEVDKDIEDDSETGE
ncbi:FKBP-type peptidyl-prolyl cis-trans isomerase [Echinicola salinicaeni]|uniref:FKBP-type peptidyl-prolyl cis-trans isomerase n=1 Tax=Echinicola salinicaeni TaxID=2762757 RepID=UPI001648F691|nr:FKBP-type peptidyl-prolyl cis-trans isomerase [Echinicola salinicaeni]